MEPLDTLMNWLNADDEQTVLQRDGVFAMLTWRDFNQPSPPALGVRTAMVLFILAVSLPMLVLAH